MLSARMENKIFLKEAHNKIWILDAPSSRYKLLPTPLSSISATAKMRTSKNVSDKAGVVCACVQYICPIWNLFFNVVSGIGIKHNESRGTNRPPLLPWKNVLYEI